jgi:potassium efflux system protein
MFAVEESTVIDGKTVTVTYGVTVGKSIGALLLFLLGYWLFARCRGGCNG